MTTVVWTYDLKYTDRYDPISQPYPNHAGDVINAPYPGSVTWADPQSIERVFPGANAVRDFGWHACLMVDLPSGVGVMVPNDQLVLDERKMPLYIIPAPRA